MAQTVRAQARLPFHRGRMRAGGLYAALCAVFFLLCAFPAVALPPQKLVMDPPVAAVERGALTLRLAVTVDNEDGLLALLKDGAVLELAVTVDVERERSFWSNAEAARAEFSSVLRHDPLSRDFVALVPTREGEKEIRDRNLNRLLQTSWRRLSLSVITLDDLLREERAESYLLLLSVALRHTEVPPWLEKSSVFWSSEVVPQARRKFVFTLPPAHAGAH